MKRELLVPLDGSRFAEQALPCALCLGQGLPAELVLFRAVCAPSNNQENPEGANPLPGEGVTEATEYLQAMAHSLRKRLPQVDCVVRTGPAARAIVDYAAQTDRQQVVMATHGQGGHRGWTGASTAESVVQAARTPVLLVHGREAASAVEPEPTSFCRVLVPLDGSEWAEQILPPITATVRALGCELVLFQVSYAFLFDFSSRAADRLAAAYLDRVAERLADQGIKATTAVRTGPIAETIVQFAESNDIDLIALPTHGRTGLAGWVMGSVAAQVVHMASGPILLVRAGRHRSRN